jgi:hypothetical protein
METCYNALMHLNSLAGLEVIVDINKFAKEEIRRIKLNKKKSKSKKYKGDTDTFIPNMLIAEAKEIESSELFIKNVFKQSPTHSERGYPWADFQTEYLYRDEIYKAECRLGYYMRFWEKVVDIIHNQLFLAESVIEYAQRLDGIPSSLDGAWRIRNYLWNKIEFEMRLLKKYEIRLIHSIHSRRNIEKKNNKRIIWPKKLIKSKAFKVERIYLF